MPPSPSAVPGSSHRRGTVHESDPDVVGDDATAAKEPESFVSLFEANVEKLGGQRLYTWHSSAECTGDIVWSYTELAQRGRAVCCALRRRWEVGDGARVMLIYPPGLDFLVAFFGCQYAAVIAVPYYPPIIPASPMPSAGAKKMLADGLAKVVRIYSSCHPELLLSTTMCALARLPPRQLPAAGSSGLAGPTRGSPRPTPPSVPACKRVASARSSSVVQHTRRPRALPVPPRRYLRLKWLSSKLLGGDCSWPSSWNWRAAREGGEAKPRQPRRQRLTARTLAARTLAARTLAARPLAARTLAARTLAARPQALHRRPLDPPPAKGGASLPRLPLHTSPPPLRLRGGLHDGAAKKNSVRTPLLVAQAAWLEGWLRQRREPVAAAHHGPGGREARH